MLKGESLVGRAIVDPTGQKPIRIGRNHDGLDLLSLGEQVKEITLEKAKKQVEAIEKNKEVVLPAIYTLQTKMESLKADAISLSNYLGALPGISNSFRNVEATVVKSGEYSQSSYVNVSVNSSVADPTTTAAVVRITQLAVVDSRISSTTTIVKSDGITPIVSATDPLGISGTLTINGGDTITVRATDTLTSIVSSINNSNSSVQASYIQNGTNYNLIINGTTLASPLTFSDSGHLLQTYFGINTTTPTDVANLEAQIQYDVVDGANGTVTKTYNFSSNIVENLIPGVTLNLLSTTKNSSGGFDNLNITLSNNSQGACEKIIPFSKNIS